MDAIVLPVFKYCTIKGGEMWKLVRLSKTELSEVFIPNMSQLSEYIVNRPLLSR